MPGQLVRIAASLKARTTPAHVVLQRLTSSGPSDRVAKALTALGRLVKTRNILRYLHDEPLGLRIKTQLNRGEARSLRFPPSCAADICAAGGTAAGQGSGPRGGDGSGDG
jgi:Tn3 transposase DDE domain